jgi:hypothetical protein
LSPVPAAARPALLDKTVPKERDESLGNTSVSLRQEHGLCVVSQVGIRSTHDNTYQIKDNRAVPGFSQAQQLFHFIVISTTCFGQLTNIRPSLQNLE